MVLPGTYQVRLTVGSWSDTQPFELMMDPRITADGVTYADLQEQVTLSLQVGNALSQARMAAAHISAAREKLAEQTDEAARARTVDEALAAIEEKIVTADLRSYPTPMLLDQLRYLYSNRDRADQKPGRDAHERFAELDGLLQGYIRDLERILRANVI